MLAFPHAIVVAGTLVAASVAAQASEVGPRHVPVPPERPLLLEVVGPASDALAESKAPPRSFRRGHRVVAAKLQPPPSVNTEAAAPSPSSGEPASGSGPHESGAPTLADLVTRHAHDNGVPVSLAQAVVRIESRGNPRASNRGALGLMQIKPATARAVGFNGGASALLVADTNLRYGMKVLGEAFRSSGGDVCRALMLYQSGHLATRMTRSNRAYCSRARAIMAGA